VHQEATPSALWNRNRQAAVVLLLFTASLLDANAPCARHAGRVICSENGH
jgi:hypothetical protein